MNPKTHVLIGKDGRARLTDFGLASIALGNSSVASLPDASLTIVATWAAPEILEGGSVTKAGDIFAFGMVATEVCPGRVSREVSQLVYPEQTFAERLSIEFYTAVSSGGRPEQPETLGDDLLWDLMQRCWDEDPGKRPTSFELVEFFQPS